jgi:sporulation protein YlmC with PRC-barrel domain
MAVLMATGAIAQNTATDSATPPAATAPAATNPVVKPATASTATQAIQFTQSASPTQMAVSKLRGTDVRNAAGEDLGDINDVLVDTAGQPSVAIIGVGGFLGIGKKNVGVPFQALQFTTNSETSYPVARLDVTKDVLTNAPTFVYADRSAPNDRPAVRTQ